MTNEQASEILDDYDVNFHGHTAEEVAQAFDCAFKALKQQPCEDCISRQAVLDINFKRIIFATTKPVEMIEQKVKALPSVTPQPKIGKWIEDVDRWGDIVTNVNGYRCSECNTFDTDKDNYCPNCGAKMQEAEE